MQNIEYTAMFRLNHNFNCNLWRTSQEKMWRRPFRYTAFVLSLFIYSSRAKRNWPYKESKHVVFPKFWDYFKMSKLYLVLMFYGRYFLHWRFHYQHHKFLGPTCDSKWMKNYSMIDLLLNGWGEVLKILKTKWFYASWSNRFNDN